MGMPPYGQSLLFLRLFSFPLLASAQRGSGTTVASGSKVPIFIKCFNFIPQYSQVEYLNKLGNIQTGRFTLAWCFAAVLHDWSPTLCIVNLPSNLWEIAACFEQCFCKWNSQITRTLYKSPLPFDRCFQRPGCWSVFDSHFYIWHIIPGLLTFHGTSTASTRFFNSFRSLGFKATLARLSIAQRWPSRILFFANDRIFNWLYGRSAASIFRQADESIPHSITNGPILPLLFVRFEVSAFQHIHLFVLKNISAYFLPEHFRRSPWASNKIILQLECLSHTKIMPEHSIFGSHTTRVPIFKLPA